MLDGDRVAPARVLDALAERGLHRVLCEGGPHLSAGLLGADAADELCLPGTHPGGGAAGRIRSALITSCEPMRLVSVLSEDHVLLLRYLRDR